MRISLRVLIAASVFCASSLLTSVANAGYILFGDGYVPQPSTPMFLPTQELSTNELRQDAGTPRHLLTCRIRC
jgi:hypothetical protein